MYIHTNPCTLTTQRFQPNHTSLSVYLHQQDKIGREGPYLKILWWGWISAYLMAPFPLFFSVSPTVDLCHVKSWSISVLWFCGRLHDQRSVDLTPPHIFFSMSFIFFLLFFVCTLMLPLCEGLTIERRRHPSSFWNKKVKIIIKGFCCSISVGLSNSVFDQLVSNKKNEGKNKFIDHNSHI